MKEEKRFNYVVGFYADNGAVLPYSYGSTVFFGTDQGAESMRKFLSERAKKELKIFKLKEA